MAKAAPASPAPQPAVAKRVREFFVQECMELLPALTEALEKRLVELTDAAMTTTDMQVRRDLLVAFGKAGPAWSKGLAAAWKRALIPPHGHRTDPPGCDGPVAAGRRGGREEDREFAPGAGGARARVVGAR